MEDLQGKLQRLSIKILEGAIERNQYYSVKEAAEILKVTTKTIRNRIEKKEIVAVFHQVGIGQSQYLIPKEALNIAASTTDVVSFSRTVSVPEIIAAVQTQVREELSSLRAENDALRSEVKEVRDSQERMEKMLQEQSEALSKAIEGKLSKPWWKIWIK